ncbi:MAG: thioredoxin-disulfide reductase [Anaerolineae bacterium]
MESDRILAGFSLSSPTEEEEKKDKYDLIIIGSGPAGFTAAIYGGRAMLSTLVIAGSSLGGTMSLTNEIENYPGFPDGITGQELATRMRQQAERFGAVVEMDEVTAVDLKIHPFKVKTHSRELEAKALIIATGTSARKLRVPGEREYAGRGVSYCAVCDGFFYRDREVIVVGGGDSALEEGLFLTRFASKVTIVHRRDELRAGKILQERAFRNKKIGFVWNSVVTEILGNEQGVTGVRLKNVETGEESILEASGVFIYIGSQPSTDFLKGQLELDELGFIATDRLGHTSVPGVFAAGDIQQPILRQIATAVGSGAVAAIEAEKFIAQLEG